MYFWNIEKLKAQLIERPLTDKETLPYVIAYALIYAIIFELVNFAYSIPPDLATKSEAYGISDFLYFIFYLIVIIFSTKWIFNKNRVYNENYFLQRYTALGWVVMIRVTVFLTIFVLLLAIITLILGWDADRVFESDKFGYIAFVMTYFVYFLYFWYFGKHISDVAQKATYHQEQT
jgi:hypothetical protein